MIAGVLSGLLREYDRALREFEEAAKLDQRLVPRCLDFAIEMAAHVTWTREQREAAERGMSEDPARVDRYARVLFGLFKEAGCSRSGDGDDLAEYLQGGGPAGRWSRPRLAASAGRWNEVESLVSQAISTALRSGDALLEGADLLLSVGKFEKSRALLEEALSATPGAADALARLARLALWSGDDAEARGGAGGESVKSIRAAGWRSRRSASWSSTEVVSRSRLSGSSARSRWTRPTPRR